MGNIKNKYSDLHFENGIPTHVWIYKEYKQVLEEALDYDARPYDEVNLTGKIFGRYDAKQIHQQLAYARGDYYSTIPIREKITQQRVKNELYYQKQKADAPVYQPQVYDIEVPADVYGKWAKLSPQDYFADFKYRQRLIDSYLNSYDADKREHLKLVMSGNSDSQNYLMFLDIDPNTMTESQKLIYENIIKYYEQLYRTEKLEEHNTLEQGIHNREVYVQSKMNKVTDYSQHEPVNYDTLTSNDLLYFENDTKKVRTNAVIEQPVFKSESSFKTNDVTQVKQQTEQVKQQTEQVKSVEPAFKTVAQQPAQKPTDLFDFDATKQKVVVTGDFIENYHTLPSTQFKNLFNIPQCYNIVDLIAVRKEAELQNRQLITEIVSDQISTNNTVVTHSGDLRGINNVETNAIPVTNYR